MEELERMITLLFLLLSGIFFTAFTIAIGSSLHNAPIQPKLMKLFAVLAIVSIFITIISWPQSHN